MQKPSAWTGLAICLLTTQALADEPATGTDPTDDAEAVDSLSELLPETAYLSEWALEDADVVEVGPYSTQRVSAFDVEFLEGSTIERLGRYRALSLVTFAEVRGARLFLGVNEDGFLGLHMNAAAKPKSDRSNEVWRTSYLEDPELLSTDTTLPPASRSSR